MNRKLLILCLFTIAGYAASAQSLDLLVGKWEITSISANSEPANYKSDTTRTFKPGQAQLLIKPSHQVVYRYKRIKSYRIDSIPKALLNPSGLLSWGSNMVSLDSFTPELFLDYSPFKIVYQMHNELALEYVQESYPLVNKKDERTGKKVAQHNAVKTTYQIRLSRLK